MLSDYFVIGIVIIGLCVSLYYILTRPESELELAADWVATGKDSTCYGNIMYSSDGISWKATSSGASFAFVGEGVAGKT